MVRVGSSMCCNVRSFETERGFSVANIEVGRVFVGRLTYIGGTTTVTGHGTNRLDRRGTGTVVCTTSGVVSNGCCSSFVISTMRNNTKASTGVGVGRILTGVTVSRLNNRGNSCGLVGPGSRIGGNRSAGSMVPATNGLTMLGLDRKLVTTLRSLCTSLVGGTRRFSSILAVNEARLRSTIPVEVNRNFGTFTATIGESVAHVRRDLSRVGRIGLNTATVNATVGTGPRCFGGIIGMLKRIAGRGLDHPSSLFSTARGISKFTRMSNTLGALSVGLSGVYGSLELVSDNPEANLTRVALPTERGNSSVVPNGIGPIVPRIMGRMYFLIVNRSIAVAVTTRTNRFRLGTFRPVVFCRVFRDVASLTDTIGALAAGYVSNVAIGERIYRVRMGGDIKVIATLGPCVNCSGTSGVTGRSLGAKGDMEALILRGGLLARRRLSGVLGPCDVA